MASLRQRLGRWSVSIRRRGQRDINENGLKTHSPKLQDLTVRRINFIQLCSLYVAQIIKFMRKTKFPFNFLISVFNSIILILYLINFDLPEGSKFFYIILFITLISFVSIFKIKFENILFKVISNFQLPIFTTIIVFFLFELIYFINPNIFPHDLRIWINKEGKNVEVIEYLDTSPFVKFKSNVKVRVRFYRGTTEQFQYGWITDSKGFKNKNSIAKLSTVDVVAIGDSFTEGMGVSIDDTLPSILSSKGYLTYNLGVQGYSPSQMLGSLKKYGIGLKPKFIVALYTMNTYDREKSYLDEKNISYTGGVGDIEAAQINPEIRNQSKFIFSALWLMTKNLRWIVINKFKYSSIELVDKKFEPYKDVAMISSYNSFPKDTRSWSATLKAFREINKISNQIGAKFILLYIPKRTVIYYERAMAKRIPKNIFNESNLLENFALKNNIIYIDPTYKLVNYVNNLPKNFTLKSLPYLEVDAHMNRIGYEIISEAIIDKLN